MATAAKKSSVTAVKKFQSSYARRKAGSPEKSERNLLIVAAGHAGASHAAVAAEHA